MITRRALARHAAGAGFFAIGAACRTTDPSSGTLPAAASAPNRVIRPAQFAVGDSGARQHLHFGVSLHCGSTRDYFRRHRARIIESVRAGEMQLLVSHICRTSEELPVGVALLELADADYPGAMLGALGLAVELDEAISLEALREFLRIARLKPAPGRNREDLLIGLMVTRRAYEERLGVRTTPFIEETTA